MYLKCVALSSCIYVQSYASMHVCTDQSSDKSSKVEATGVLEFDS
jgi:hypothetical protein